MTKLLKIAQLAKSTFFYHLKILSKPDKNVEIKEQIKSIFEDNKGIYGYRRITLALKNKGLIVNHKKVLKIMQELGLRSIQRPLRRKYNSYKGQIGKIAKNVLNRNFEANKPYKKLVTDVTEFKISTGEKLYLSPIIDLFNREVISFNISKRPKFDQIIDMLNKAFEIIPNNSNCILHSDQGWQYQLEKYQNILKEKGIIQSMSRKGNCLDNSVAENFFSVLKSEIFYPKEKEYTNLDDLEKDIIEYIDYYNNKRIKAKLNGMSPIEFRKHSIKIT